MPADRKIAAKREVYISLLVISLLAAVAYMPLSGQLGFYFNDWYPLTSRIAQTPLTIMFSLDRPRLGDVYNLTYGLLGDDPVAWQWFTFAWRLAGGLAFFWLVRLLWPRQRLATTAMAVLFMVYPGFLQQTIALTFSNHMIGYALGLFSLVFTVLAVQQPSWPRRLGLIALALVTELAYLFLYEYMIGLEVARLVLVALLLHRQRPLQLNLKAGLRILSQWWFYLIPMGGFLYWRLFIFKSMRGTTNVDSLLLAYLREPVEMVSRLVIESLRDFIEAAYLAWGVPLNQVAINASFADILTGAGWALAGLAVYFLYRLWVRRSQTGAEPEEPGVQRWAVEAVALGALFTLATIFPVVLSNRHIQYKDLMDRYTLHTTIGVAMLVVGSIHLLLRPRWQQAAVGLLIAVSILTHYNNAVYYRDLWAYQKQLWWQLAWRAPQLKYGTALVPLLPDRYRLQESFEVWAPANAIYQTEPGLLVVSGEILNRDTAPSMARRDKLDRGVRRIYFTNDYQNTLLASLPGGGLCLHVVDGRQVELTQFDDVTVREVARASNIDTIDTAAPQRIPPAEPFGLEPEHGWCYYYQKASLARQQGEWETAAALGDEALALGLAPQDPVEWLPIIEAYHNLGRTADADELSKEVRRSDFRRRLLCDHLAASSGAYSSPEIYARMVAGLCQAEP